MVDLNPIDAAESLGSDIGGAVTKTADWIKSQVGKPAYQQGSGPLPVEPEWVKDNVTKPTIRWGAAGGQYGYEVGINALQSAAPAKTLFPGLTSAEHGIGAATNYIATKGHLAPLLHADSGTATFTAPRPANAGDIFWHGTTLGQMIENGGGTGYLPPASATQAAAAVQRQVRGTVGAHAATPGRVFAGSFLEPDTLPYNVASGAVDMFTTLNYDPSIVAGNAWHGLTSTHSIFALGDDTVDALAKADRPADIQRILGAGRGDAALHADLALATTPDAVKGVLASAGHADYAEAGAITGLRKYFNPQKFSDWVDSWKGQRVVNALTASDTPDMVRSLFRGKADFQPQLYSALANATDAETVRTVLNDAVNSGMRDVPKSGYFVDPLQRYAVKEMVQDARPFNMMPRALSDPKDPTDFLSNFESNIRNWKLAPAVRTRLMNAAIDMYSHPGDIDVRGPALMRDYGDSVYRKALGDRYWQTDDARSLVSGLVTEVKRGEPDAVRQGLELSFPDAKITDDIVDQVMHLGSGEPLVQPALSPSEMLGGVESIDTDAQRAENIRQFLASKHEDLGLTSRVYSRKDVAYDLHLWRAESVAGTRAAFIDAAAPGGVGQMINGGETVPIGDAHLENEFLHGNVEFADPRAVRRQVSWANNILHANADSPWWKPEIGLWANKDGQQRMLFAFFDAMSAGWKALTVTRPALFLRVLLDNQLALAASGDTNAIAHPMDYWAAVLASKDDADLTGTRFAEMRNDMGSKFAEVAGTDSNHLNGAVVRARGVYVPVNPGGRGADRLKYLDGWAGELSQLGNSPTARTVAQDMVAGGDAQAVKDSFWDGPLAAFRGKIIRTADPLDPEDWAHRLNDRGWSDAYIDTVARRVGLKTAGDDSLLQAVADNSFNGKPLGDYYKPDKDFRQHLQGLYESGTNAGAVKARLTLGEGSRGRVSKWMDEKQAWIWDKLITVPSSNLSKSPAFKQFYWDEVDRLLPNLSPEERAAVEDALTAGNERSAMRNFTSGVSSTGQLTAAEVDGLAKAAGLNRVNELMYDAHQRSNFTDALRSIIPFGEVFRQQATRWGRLAIDDAPRMLRRSTQALQNARSSGLFYTDPQTGKEMFHVPVPAALPAAISMLPGMHGTVDTGMQFQAPVQGLNLFSQGLPGVGAVAGIPADRLLRYVPHGDQIRQIVEPYGPPPTGKGLTGFLTAFMPSWTQKLATAWNGPGQSEFLHTMGDVMIYLRARNPGRYPTTSEGDSRLLEDAKDATRTLYITRGITQAFSPAAPTFDQQVAGQQFLKNGTWSPDDHTVELWTVAQRWYQIQHDTIDVKGGTTSDAAAEFLNEFGPNLAQVMVPKTMPLVYGLSATKGMAQFKRDNPDFVKKYPNTWPLFVVGTSPTQTVDTGETPSGPAFSYGDYLTQLEQGDRVDLSGPERNDLAEYRVASSIYDRYRNQVGLNPTDAQQAWLDNIKRRLEDQYAAYAAYGGQFPGSIKPKELADAAIQEAAKAAQERPGDPLSQAILTYSNYRKEALDANGFKSGTSLRNQGSGPLRAWLRNIGAQLAHDVPGFGTVYDTLYSHEVADPTNVSSQ